MLKLKMSTKFKIVSAVCKVLRLPDPYKEVFPYLKEDYQVVKVVLTHFEEVKSLQTPIPKWLKEAIKKDLLAQVGPSLEERGSLKFQEKLLFGGSTVYSVELQVLEKKN